MRLMSYEWNRWDGDEGMKNNDWIRYDDINGRILGYIYIRIR